MKKNSLNFSVTKQSVDQENNIIGEDRRLGRQTTENRELAVDNEEEETQIVQLLRYSAKILSVGFIFSVVFLTCLLSKLLLIQIVSNQKYKDRNTKNRDGDYIPWYLNWHRNDTLLLIGEILPFLYCSYIVKFKKDASLFCKDLFMKMLIPEALDVFGTHLFVWLVIPNCKQVTTICIMSCVYSVPALLNVLLTPADSYKIRSTPSLMNFVGAITQVLMLFVIVASLAWKKAWMVAFAVLVTVICQSTRFLWNHIAPSYKYAGCIKSKTKLSAAKDTHLSEIEKRRGWNNFWLAAFRMLFLVFLMLCFRPISTNTLLKVRHSETSSIGKGFANARLKSADSKLGFALTDWVSDFDLSASKNFLKIMINNKPVGRRTSPKNGVKKPVNTKNRSKNKNNRFTSNRFVPHRRFDRSVRSTEKRNTDRYCTLANVNCNELTFWYTVCSMLAFYFAYVASTTSVQKYCFTAATWLVQPAAILYAAFVQWNSFSDTVPMVNIAFLVFWALLSGLSIVGCTVRSTSCVRLPQFGRFWIFSSVSIFWAGHFTENVQK